MIWADDCTNGARRMIILAADLCSEELDRGERGEQCHGDHTHADRHVLLEQEKLVSHERLCGDGFPERLFHGLGLRACVVFADAGSGEPIYVPELIEEELRFGHGLNLTLQAQLAKEGA